MTDETKYFSSPNFEVEYQANSDCTWELEAEEGKKIELYIEEFETEQCCDSVTVSCCCFSFQYLESNSGSHIKHYDFGSFPLLSSLDSQYTQNR